MKIFLIFKKNKPERVFKFFRNFFGIFLEFFLKFFGNCSEGFFWRIFFGENFWRNFLGEIFWKDFLGGFFGRILWEDFFLGGFFWEDFWEDCIWRNSLFYFNVEGIDLFVKILVFVKIFSKSTRKEEEFRSLEVRL